MAHETASPTPSAADPAVPGHAVRVADLHKHFNGTSAVNGASFSVPTGSIMALVGPSGCGKTTTLRIIAGFEQPDSGTVEIDGRMVAGPERPVPAERRRVGMVFQDYALFPHMSVRDNVAFGVGGRRSLLRRRQHRTERGDARVAEALELVGLARAAERMPHELSGGEQQRVALARALAPNPSVVLLDEPFSNLDAALRTRVRADVKHILREAGCTSVFVTHDQEEAFVLADQVGVMLGGRLEQVGEPGDVYANPESLAVAAFLGDANVIDGVAQGGSVETALGRLPAKGEARGDVKVVIRPESIWVRTDGVGANPAQIIDREFYGHHQVVVVRRLDGPTLRARMGPQVPMAVGDEVTIEVQGTVAIFPAPHAAS